MVNIRVTRVGAETLIQNDGVLRVTRVGAETLIQNAGFAFFTRVAAETLLVQPPDPIAPENLTATTQAIPNHNSILLEWDDMSGFDGLRNEDHFQIEYSRDGIDWELLDTVAADIETYLAEGLNFGTEYFFRVGAVNDWNSFGSPNVVTSLSEVASTTTGQAGSNVLPIIEGLVTHFDASVFELTDGASVLNWTDETGNVSLAEDGAPTFDTPNQNGLGGVEFLGQEQLELVGAGPFPNPATMFLAGRTPAFTGVTTYMQEEPYQAFLSATGEWSFGWVGTGASIGFVDESLRDNAVIFSAVLRAEDAFVRADGIEKVRDDIAAPDPLTSWRYGSGVNEPGRNFTLNETIYYDQVLSDEDIEAVESYLYLKWLITNTAPAAPSVLTATTVDFESISLEWTDNSHNEDGLRIEVSPNGDTGWEEFETVPALTEAFLAEGLEGLTTHFFRVVAFNEFGDSDPSNVDSDTTLKPPASSPVELTAVALSGEVIRINWIDTSDFENHFRLETSFDELDWQLIEDEIPADLDPPPSGQEYMLGELIPDTLYFFRVWAVNEIGENVSNVVSARTGPLFVDQAPPRLSEEGVGAWSPVENSTVALRLGFHPYPILTSDDA